MDVYEKKEVLFIKKIENFLNIKIKSWQIENEIKYFWLKEKKLLEVLVLQTKDNQEFILYRDDLYKILEIPKNCKLYYKELSFIEFMFLGFLREKCYYYIKKN